MEVESNQHKDVFDEEFGEESSSVQNIVTIAAILIAAVIFIGLSWYAYRSFNEASQNDKIPTISADHNPAKIIPDDPGGMKFPNMDKQIYGKLSKKDPAPKVERILPGPEEPVDKNMVAKSLVEHNEAREHHEVHEHNEVQEHNKVSEHASHDAAIEDGKQDLHKSNEALKQPQEATPAIHEKPQLNKNAEAEDAIKIAKSKDVSKKPDIDIAKNTPSSPSKFSKTDYNTKGPGKYYRIQIASFKSEKVAEQEWKTRSSMPNSILKNYAHFVEKKNLPGKGVVYRLQIGQFENESEASELCKKLKSSNIDCFTLRP